MLSVSDDGSGMSDQVLARVFEPFFTTKAVGKGSGLGLSQVYGLAKQSGGGVTIDTAVGQGATIRIFLPRAHAKPAKEIIPLTMVSAAPLPDTKVLVVDDDEAVRAVTSGILADLGYCVVEAGSGGAALDLLEEHPDIQAAVLDFAMPGMNGGEVARELAARRPGLPVLFATGYADIEALAATSEDRIIHKPFNQNDLAAKLSLALR